MSALLNYFSSHSTGLGVMVGQLALMLVVLLATLAVLRKCSLILEVSMQNAQRNAKLSQMNQEREAGENADMTAAIGELNRKLDEAAYPIDRERL